MSDFLYLFRSTAPEMKPSAQEMQQSMQRWGEWIQRLAQAGHFRAGDPLESVGRVVGGSDRLMTDGPFAESKEIVGGYLVITANDLDEATELSRGCPIFDDIRAMRGSVEIRPIRPRGM
jgi:hypothetical protein